MKQRWRSLVRPEHEGDVSPDAGEALGIWMLGVLWALVCLWLGYLGGYWVLPAVLLAGLIALWGWRHVEWLWWFPTVLVLASMLQPLSPLRVRTSFGPLNYLDLLALGVALIAVVRAVGLRLPLLPRTPVDGLVLAILVLFGVSLLWPSGHVLTDMKRIAVRLVVFYATTTVASRPYGSRWVWLAFPLASALLGIHAIWAQAQSPTLLAEQVRIADQAWGTERGILNVLLVALPVSFGLSLNAGRMPARVAWMFASLVGTAGLTLHVSNLAPLFPGMSPESRWTPLEIGRTGLAGITLLTLAWLAWKVREGRVHETSRWVAMIVTFVGFGALVFMDHVFSGPAPSLLAVAAGLVVGTLRADRRAMRSGRIVAPLSKAA
jgi:hypothetical protein